MRPIKILVDKLTNTGTLKIKFSDYIRLPSNVTEWSHQNEGADFINITYTPSDYSEQVFDENEIVMGFGWFVS